MMISKLQNSTKIRYTFWIVSLLLSFACSPSDKTVIEELEELAKEEQDYISKLMTVEAQINDIWNGFNCLRDFPIFIITEPDQGIFINPPSSQLAESKKITFELSGFESLALYRNPNMLAVAQAEVPGNQFFSFSNHNGLPFFVFELSTPGTDFYSSYKNRNGHFHVSIFFHELFHVYQLIKNSSRYLSPEREQNILDYPLTEETLPFLLLLFDVMSDAYHQETEADQLKFLTYYVAIQQKLSQLDNTANHLVRNHGFYQEKTEGAARYVEVFATLHTIDNNTIEDPTHGFKEFADAIATSTEVRTVYAFRIFYHTGAGAIHLLKELDHPNLEQSFLIPTNTPYDVAKSFLNISDAELNIALEEVKTLYNWEIILSRAEFLLDLP